MKSNDNLHYVGSFSTLQTQGSNELMNYGIKYTAKQQELYYRLLKGLKIYTPEELYVMNSTKKKRINKAHSKAQTIINLYKQQKMIELTDPILNLFTKKNEFTFSSELDPNFFCTLPFTALSITKEDIINVFKEENLLPANFDVL